MNPTTILIVLLTIVAMRPFFELPETRERVEAQRRGGYAPNATRSCLYMLLLPVVLGLWWWYALTTEQVLLGVIPTVGAALSVLATVIDSAARKQAAR